MRLNVLPAVLSMLALAATVGGWSARQVENKDDSGLDPSSPAANDISLLEASIRSKLLELHARRPALQPASLRHRRSRQGPWLDNQPDRLEASPDLPRDVKSCVLYTFRYTGSEGPYRYKFNLSASRFAGSVEAGDISDDECVVHGATLYLYKDAVAPGPVGGDGRSTLPDVVLAAYELMPGVQRRLISSAVVSLSGPGWVRFDVTGAVRRWAAGATTEITLAVESASASLNISDLVSIDVRSVRRLPALDVRLYRRPNDAEDEGRRLSRRGIKTSAATAKSLSRPPSAKQHQPCAAGECCRKRVYVSFEKLNWHWITHPPGFDAYYCAGRCAKHHKPGTNFGRLKQALRASNIANLTNSCTPTAYSPLVVWERDEFGQPVQTVLEDMIVERCGCT